MADTADTMDTKTPTPAPAENIPGEPAPSSSTSGTADTVNTPTNEPNSPASPADAPGRTSTDSGHTLTDLDDDTRLLDTLNTLIVALNTTPGDNPGFDPEHGEFVPTYTETADPSPPDSDPLLTLLTTHPSLTTLLGLPLTAYPLPLTPLPPWTPALGYHTPSSTLTNPLATHPTLTPTQKQTLHSTQVHIIKTFFTAITTANTPLLTAYITHGLLSPDTPSATGLTPLLAAITANNPPIACHLISLGAQPNLPGTAPTSPTPYHYNTALAGGIDRWIAFAAPPSPATLWYVQVGAVVYSPLQAVSGVVRTCSRTRDSGLAPG